MTITRASLLAVLLVLTAAPPARAKVKHVKVRTISGSVSVTGSAKATRVTGTGTMQVEGDLVEVSARSDDVSIVVPAGVTLETRTKSGAVTVTGVRGPLNHRSVSGDLELDGGRGGLDVRCVSCTVRVKGLTGRARIKTVSGDIVLGGKLADISASTISGDISLDSLVGSSSSKVRTTSGEVSLRGSLGKGARLKVHAHSGDVQAVLRAPAGARFALRSFSGALIVRPGARAKVQRHEKSASGQMGRGGASLELSSFSGDIDLKLRE
jgi:DUF4097 and DUF4098 domain-containing protein YvlB